MRALVALALLPSAIAHADPGRYKLDQRTDAFPIGDKLPSCGVQEAMVRQQWPTLLIEHTKAGHVVVNDSEWRFIGTGPATFGARREQPWEGFTVAVLFWRGRRGTAHGTLAITKNNTNDEPVCADLVGYGGTFVR